jgi:hypothetical protein
LGDRAYGPQKFCVAGRKLAARLRQLGAFLYVDPGYGDDGTPNGGVFCDLDQWLQTTLLPKLSSSRRNEPASSNLCTAIVASPYHISQSKRSCNGHDRQLVEWRNDAYRNDYLSFFQSLCPLTAYQYDQHCNRSVAENEYTQGVRIPLVASVLENRRITSMTATKIRDTCGSRLRASKSSMKRPKAKKFRHSISGVQKRCLIGLEISRSSCRATRQAQSKPFSTYSRCLCRPWRMQISRSTMTPPIMHRFPAWAIRIGQQSAHCVDG